MKLKQSKILLVDDDVTLLETLALCLNDLGYITHTVANSQNAIELIKNEHFDLVFTDIFVPPLDGFAVLEEIKKYSPDVPVIIISGFSQFDQALKAVEMGAYHILQKPFEMKELPFFVKKAIEYHSIKSELTKIKERFYNLVVNSKFITQNREFLKNIELAEQVAESDISVLILGESGTGKELMAEFIHEKSSRADKPFIKVNCAGIPEGLLESELFGHVKDGFIGATKNMRGKFELADGGTIFLNEIGEMPFSFQSKLLRVLRTKEFESVGDSEIKKLNVRILSATSVNLEAAIQEKTFKDDLFYCLNGVSIKILPLRERIEDIEILIHSFTEKFSKNNRMEVTRDALFILKSHPWRGNVKELENTIHRAVVLAKDSPIDVSHLPEEFRNASQNKMDDLFSLEEIEKKHISKILSYTSDYKEAADILKIDIATLWRKRKKYSI